MAIFQGIRNYFAERSLKKIRNRKRIRRISNYHEAKEIGILYASDSESTFVLIKHFIDYLRKEHGILHVKALGFIDDKEEPIYHVHALHHDYFTRKEINWMGNPGGTAAESFIENDFDILIDLTKSEWMPLRFILDRSVARFKVGRAVESESYDLLVAAGEQTALDDYIHQINHFLQSINHHEERKRV